MGDDPKGTGGTPGDGGTPAQPKPGDGGTPEPTDDVAGLKSALSAERLKAKNAEKAANDARAELERIQTETASDTDKALQQARREGETSERLKWQELIRAAEVRGALRGAGIDNESILALATAAPEFKDLKVGDDGSVQGVNEALEAFKTGVPALFTKPEDPKNRTVPPVAAGVQAGDRGEPKPGYDRLSQAYADIEAKRT